MLVELSFCEVVAEQISEGQAVQAVAVAGNGEVVLVSVHVSYHAADVEKAGDGLVVFVAHFHIHARTQAAHNRHEGAGVHRGVIRTFVLDFYQEVGVLIEIFVYALFAQFVVSGYDFL